VFYAGEDANSKRLNEEIGWAIRKGADQSVTSSTALVNDTALTWAVDASTNYLFDLQLVCTGNVAGNITIGFAVPAGSSGGWSAVGLDTSLAYKNIGNVALGTTSAFGTAGASIARLIQVCGFLRVDTTPGNFVVRFAQATSNATATTMRAGTVGTLFRV
jgi:hypothetical protein